jgi:hypothetical protein
LREEERYPRQHASEGSETPLTTREEPLVLQTSRPAQHGKASRNIKDHRNEAEHGEGELLTKNAGG